MNKLLFATLSLFVFLGTYTTSAQNDKDCDRLELQYYNFYKNSDYKGAYPIWKQALQQCPTRNNVYVYGEEILDNLIASAPNDMEKKKYAQELSDMIDAHIQHISNGKKAFWMGEKINYNLDNGLYDKQTAYNEYKKLFSSSEDVQKVSANTTLNYYTLALELMNENVIDFQEVLDVYYQTKKVAEKNIEIRSEEFGVLAEKKDSLSQLTPPKKLTKQEEERMENAQAAKDIYVNVYDSMEGVLKEYTTCENVAPMFEAKFEENKDSIEWIIGAYQSLASSDCYDSPIMAKLEKRYNELGTTTTTVTTTNGGGGTVSSSYGEAARLFKQGSYSAAVDKFKTALNEVSGSKKGDVAYYIALSYQKMGSNSNAISWAKKAANYKPGWGAPYQVIASVFGANANNCGNNTFTKLSTYWVAADYANKACSVDSRSCKWARSAAASYNANAPTQEMIFQQGKKKGDRVSISCFGGATTRVR